MNRKSIKKAFTLVEILIVVVILGILAAIVVPQFTSATQDSQAGNIKSQVSTLQRQIELYFAKNNSYPDFANENWGTAADVTSMIGGNFIKAAPKNPAWPDQTSANASAIAVAAAFGDAAAGWVWHSGNRQLYASYFKDNPASSADADFNKVYTGNFAAGSE
ncbi:MAG TPA: prepilin-type N-terminal cleavage/methylation domain-containing protein [Phycisphaerales bacterium]|nr:prepilin-type N-terminal cleavage/methylation domain-containing protein [Phycisphaerales bacterium]